MTINKIIKNIINLTGNTFQKIELVYPIDKVGNRVKLIDRIERYFCKKDKR
ncbi:hypothetical protein PIPA1_33770 [Pelosinus sp. IPA-1]|nr:hypothetical protein PIPA1_33770 [Pelosinus sp. IPA-1]